LLRNRLFRSYRMTSDWHITNRILSIVVINNIIRTLSNDGNTHIRCKTGISLRYALKNGPSYCHCDVSVISTTSAATGEDKYQ